MSKNNRTCAACSSSYYYCQSCPDEHRETWHIMFCCESCKTVFDVITKYYYKHIDKEQARELLKDIDLSDTSKYSKGTQEQLKEIFSYENTNGEKPKVEFIEKEQLKRPLTVKKTKNLNGHK